MTTPLFASILRLFVFFAVVALIMYRLLWSGPFLAALARVGLLPKSWRRWLFGESRLKKPS
jgi:hypothetical protein